MDTNFFKLYLEANKKLVKTLCIKSETSAEMLQDYIQTNKGIIKPSDKSQWKYYMNICGMYHSTDAVMTVTSLDTLEPIVFSKENLVIHTATKKAYTYGTRYYYSLLNDHPEQELLINGILLPADMTYAVSAKDWSILSYDSTLVEPQETTLIHKLEDYIYSHQNRWHIGAFGVTDNLYNASQFAVLCLNLVPKLLNIRASMCKTHETHSFHIREYLASHGRLDKFMPYMTYKQIMFLYRNINYIDRNSGKVEQFKLLIDKLLSDRSIPLAELSIRQLPTFDSENYPEVRVRKKPLNLETNVPEKDYYALDKLYLNESKAVYFNETFLDGVSSSITERLKTTSSSVLQTKDLQSSMLDYTDSVPDTMEEVLVRTWLQMAKMGYYDVYSTFKDPKTSNLYTLNATDAFIYYLYVLYKRHNIATEYIPDHIGIKEVRHPRPSLSTMLASVKVDMFSDMPSIAQALLDDMPHLTPVYSKDSFLTLVEKLYNSVQRQWFVTGNEGELFKKAQLSSMMLTLYRDKRHKLVSYPTLFTDWLIEKNLPEYNYTDVEAGLLLYNIFTAATGYVVDETKQMANIQKAMIGLMSQLSSYSVQYLREINSSEVIPVNWSAIRVGEGLCDVELEEDAKTGVDLLSMDMEAESYIEVETMVDKNYDVYEISAYIEKDIPTKVDALLTATYTVETSITFPGHVMEPEYPGYNPSVYNQTGYLGHEIYLSLTQEEKDLLKFA